MSNRLTFDLSTAHRHFSVDCFNAAWNLIDRPLRTPADEEQMLLRTFASFYHWTQRPDFSAENRAIAIWQISRVYALLGQADNARRYAEKCLTESDSPALPAYCLAYAYEALARAEMVAGKPEKMRAWLARALSLAEKLAEVETRQNLIADLQTLH